MALFLLPFRVRLWLCWRAVRMGAWESAVSLADSAALFAKTAVLSQNSAALSRVVSRQIPEGSRRWPWRRLPAERDSGGENGGHGGVGERKISGFIARIHKMDGTGRPFPSASPCFGLPVREAYCALRPILPLSRSTRRLSGPMLKRRSMMERLGTKPLRRANTWK